MKISRCEVVAVLMRVDFKKPKHDSVASFTVITLNDAEGSYVVNIAIAVRYKGGLERSDKLQVGYVVLSAVIISPRRVESRHTDSRFSQPPSLLSKPVRQ